MKKVFSFMFLIGLVMLLLSFTASFAGQDEPGPSFEGWADGGTDSWHSQHLTLHHYSDHDKQPVEVGMRVIWEPTGEVVMKGWGMTFENGAYNIDNVRVALKLEDGTWVFGKKGAMFHVEHEISDGGIPLFGFYVVTESNREIGRLFPK